MDAIQSKHSIRILQRFLISYYFSLKEKKQKTDCRPVIIFQAYCDQMRARTLKSAKLYSKPHDFP